MIAFNRFKEIIDHFDTQTKCEEVLSSAQNHFFLKPYKIRKINSGQAKNIFLSLQRKYEIKQLEQQPINWHKNQRKVYIWFLICYCRIRRTLPDRMKRDQWNYLGTIFQTKDSLLLKYQGLSILKNEGKKLWPADEDEILVKLVRQIGQGNWNQISKAIFFNDRCEKFITPKQCRQRWYNHKSQQIIKGEWTTQEDYKLLHYCFYKQKSWCKIVKVLNNTRTQHMIKNRFYCLLKKIDKINFKSERQKIQYGLQKLEEKIGHRNLVQGANLNFKIMSQNNSGSQSIEAQKKGKKSEKWETNVSYQENPQPSIFATNLVPSFLNSSPFLGYFLPISTPLENEYEKANRIEKDIKKGFTFYENPSTYKFNELISLEKETLKTMQTDNFPLKQQQIYSKAQIKKVITLQKSQ